MTRFKERFKDTTTNFNQLSLSENSRIYLIQYLHGLHWMGILVTLLLFFGRTARECRIRALGEDLQ